MTFSICFLANPVVCLKNMWNTKRFAFNAILINFLSFCKKIENVYISLNGEVQVCLYIMSSSVI